MNKSELVRAIADKTKVKQRDCESMLKAFTDTVMKAVKKGDKVSLVGFGSFGIVQRKARTGRNPATGQKIKIAAKKVPKFTAGKEFRDKVG